MGLYICFSRREPRKKDFVKKKLVKAGRTHLIFER